MLSVIIPAFNEETTVRLAAETIGALLAGEQIGYELVFVDDGSRDATWEKICDACAADQNVRGLHFSRNFGKEAAMFAGLENARGDCCAVMDCDLQHPPETLVEMYRLWEQGYEVVEGVKDDRGKESGLHALAAGSFYKLVSWAAQFNMRNSSDFKLLDRKVVDAINAMPERHVFFRALSYWVGFKRAEVHYNVRERVAGESKWSTRSLIRYAVHNIASFSSAPMQLVTWVGVIFCVFAVVLGIQTLVRLIMGLSLEGFTTVILLILLSSGLIMLSLGIIGFYFARMYDEIKGRPRYIISEKRGGISSSAVPDGQGDGRA